MIVALVNNHELCAQVRAEALPDDLTGAGGWGCRQRALLMVALVSNDGHCGQS